MHSRAAFAASLIVSLLTACQKEGTRTVDSNEADSRKAPTAQSRSAADSSARRTVIKTGVYYGERFVDNEESLAVAADGIEYSLKSYAKDESYPDLHKDLPLDEALWKDLLARVDIEAIKQLPAKLGEPDARDQGGEWIEVSQGGFQKRIDFEAGADVPEVHPLLDEVRKLRAKVSAEHGRNAPAD